MSTTYPQWDGTNFPDSVDTFDRMMDLTADYLTLAAQYQTNVLAGNMEAATAILNANPNMKKMIHDASKINKIYDAISAIQTFYMTDVQDYLVNIIAYKGTYSATAQYKKYDVVAYTNNDAVESYMCIDSSAPIGTLPTNTTYFVALVLRGATGASGTGLAFRGVWNSATTYAVNDCATYQNCMWATLTSNTNSAPSTTNANWALVLDADTLVADVNATMNTILDGTAGVYAIYA